ncbi:MAG TPA: carboxylesterase family protein [Rugosimonospora sp.]|nr:carboxylesterase family protein [Rugosimonospora sp.]
MKFGLLALAAVVAVPLFAQTSLAAQQGVRVRKVLEKAPASRTRGPLVRIQTGLLRGTTKPGVDSFLGIPYAQPPVGSLRWRPPQPVRPWRGERAATAYGSRCAALVSTNGPRSESEDCLFINVQRPTGTRPGARLPVLFWIHGGSLMNGSSSQHDGTLIVQNTGVIVVTMNYRLGVFGFLAHPALSAEAGQSGDYALLDQQAALRWVRQNIEAFGGDPRRVTVGGESAGAQSVCMHLVAPGSRGLFSRAIVESGSCTSWPIADAQIAGVAFAHVLGCTNDAQAAACLRGKTPAQLLDATPQPPVRFVSGIPSMPMVPDTAVRAGDFARVPLLFGGNRDEGRTFTQGFIGFTQAQYTSFVQGLFGTRAAVLLARYPWPKNATKFTAAYLVGAMLTDSGVIVGIGGCATRALTQAVARFTRVYSYEFDHRDGPGLKPIPGYVWGAGHAAELAYLWPSFDNGTPIAATFNAGEKRLALDMVRYWGSFIRGGQPFARGSALWPAYNRGQLSLSLRAGGGSVLIRDQTIATEHNCDLWPQL